MSVSSQTLSPRPDEGVSSPTGQRAGLHPGLEVLIVAALFGAIMIGSTRAGFSLGGPAALIACVIAITGLQRLRGETWVDLGFKGPRNVSGFVLGTLVMTGVVVTAFLANALLAPVLTALLGQEAAQRTLPDVNTWIDYLVIMAIVWTTAAFAEEMVFRGFFMTRIADVFGRGFAGWTLALIIPAVLFGLAHLYQGIAGVIVTASVGLVFGIWYLIGKRNLLPLIIAHGVINSIGITLLFLVAQGVVPAQALPG